MTLEEIKDYLHIDADFDDDDDLLEMLLEAAKQFIKEATGKEFEEENKLYKLLILILISHYYEHREAVSDGTLTEVPYTIKSLLTHLSIAGAWDNE